MAVNQVDILNFSLNTDDPEFGYAFNRECDTLMETVLPQIIDEELAHFSTNGAYVHLEQLEVNVGSVAPEDFFRHYPHRFRQALRAALEDCFSLPVDEGRRKNDETDEWWDAWVYFIRSGRLPWHLNAHIESIAVLFAYILRHRAAALVSYLRSYGHLANIQQRLVFQLDDEEIKQLVGALRPAERGFIVGYADALISKYRKAPERQVSGTDYRHAVWLVILSYLLTDRSSFFDKKDFIRWTITRLAANYNTSYGFLLSQLTAELDTYLRGNIQYPELILLLRDLQQESAGADGIQPHRQLLVKVLADPGSCHRYIASLTEQAIRRLVYIVVESKRDADFVVSYATYLDEQRDAILGQRAGRDFQKVKWRIIFPLLLQRNGTTLDQRWVVRSVLSGIAAHYNLNVVQIVEWIQPLLETFPVNPYIREFVNEWHAELLGQGKATGAGLSGSGATRDSDVVIADASLAQWRAWLEDSNKRVKALERLDEVGHQQLLAFLFPEEQPFVIAYATALEALAERGVVRSATPASWQAIKWSFLYGVLIETQRQVFNKKHIVRRVLDRLAAHYNVRFEALIVYLRTHIPTYLKGLSYDLVSAIHELHDEVAGRHAPPPDAEVHALFARYYPELAASITALGVAKTSSAYLQLAEKLIRIEIQLFKRLKRILGTRYPRREWLEYLDALSHSTTSWNFSQALSHLLAIWMSVARSEAEQRLLLEALTGIAAGEPVLRGYLRTNDLPLGQSSLRVSSPEAETDTHPRFVHNAGLVLLAPFMPRLFAAAGLLDESKRWFRDRDSQIRGIFLLQYAAFGEGAFPEYELELNKLLTGFRTGVPIPKELALSDGEKNLVKGMLGGVLQHWEKLQHSSVAALRESFLQRDGRLFENDETMQLHVAAKAFDMLLDTLPWKFNVIRHPWMECGIYVTWR